MTHQPSFASPDGPSEAIYYDGWGYRIERLTVPIYTASLTPHDRGNNVVWKSDSEMVVTGHTEIYRLSFNGRTVGKSHETLDEALAAMRQHRNR